ncbi:MAG: NAD(P)-binding domain-containing protein, partial [Alphaproteobacteria bacterium]|nr:NAD(P)-binding domain-containing protein [Alphaproteobacteria bacterium]
MTQQDLARDIGTIAVVGGTGALGSGLAFRWARAGLKVVIGSRDAAKAAEKAAEIGEKANAAVSGDANAAAAAAADLVVLSVPFAQRDATLESIAPHLAGKILIDCTVPLVPPKVGRVQLQQAGPAVMQVQERLGENVQVVSAFQNIGAG